MSKAHARAPPAATTVTVNEQGESSAKRAVLGHAGADAERGCSQSDAAAVGKGCVVADASPDDVGVAEVLQAASSDGEDGDGWRSRSVSARVSPRTPSATEVPTRVEADVRLDSPASCRVGRLELSQVRDVSSCTRASVLPLFRLVPPGLAPDRAL